MVFKDLTWDMITYTVAVHKEGIVLSPGTLQYLEVKGLKKKSAKENEEKSVK